MLLFRHQESRVVPADPKEIFDLVADVRGHAALAGSGEVKAVRLLGDGPIGLGTRFEADEEIKFGPGMQKFVASSEIVEFDPPRVVSWTSHPPGRPRARRIQWWFRLDPVSDGTRVTETVEVDINPVADIVLKPVYGRMRGGAIREGMRRTLDNLTGRVTGPPDADPSSHRA